MKLGLFEFLVGGDASMLGIIIVGVICGLISKAITKSRRMSGGFWWGFFLWIIGIIIVAVRPNDAKKKEESIDDIPHIFFCPNCKKTYRGISGQDYDNCPNCGDFLLETTILRDVWQEYSADKKAKMKRAFADGKYLRTSQYVNSSSTVIGGADEIKKYKELLDNGAITQEEFDAKKKQLLGL